ncbi:MAG: deoxyribonuclease IV [Actinomycetia bacterium]|nr:deoxyribonuclease IV [Actinomycetes bacterium]
MASSGRTTVPTSPLVGAHVPVSGGLAKRGLAYADEIGAECVQVFVTNPRGWAAAKGDPLQDVAFRRIVTDQLPAYVHASFLINLGSPDPAIAEKSATSLAHTIERAWQIGARGVVVHTGSAVSKRRYDDAMTQTRDLLLPILDALPDNAPPVLLEPTAGQGQSLCSTLDELDEYLHRLGHHPRLGICVDTCHFFAAGHDLADDGGMNDFLDHLEKVRGTVPVGLVHANDSMDVVGAKKDRHMAIGAGHVGAEPFRHLLSHPTMQQVPLVIETPGNEAEHAADVALLKSLR